MMLYVTPWLTRITMHREILPSLGEQTELFVW